MSRRASSSTRNRRPRLPDKIGEYPLGRQTRLPLIICDECGLQRVLELVAQTDDNGNKGRVFFKCPRNMQGREYLAKLVDMGKIVMNLKQHGAVEEEADSRALVPVQKNSMEVKLDALVGAVKALSLVMGAGVVVRAMYVMK
ncbi:unnamed protein product [Miscanthus lutarioriparius]|uniref:Zinc finger GRF-type domain-containing protein n=1 Tax=Miscanthus lutarioriparius TaxID=422564 RepID=A0A811R3K3_9POAL|nr:unnamed protein product [Miscanthus lutarioriparius]